MMQRGFTLLEMMLATVVGAMVVLAAIGTLGLVNRTEERLAQGYDDVVELARVQNTLRRGMQSLVAANPAAQAAAAQGAGGQATGAQAADDDDDAAPPPAPGAPDDDDDEDDEGEDDDNAGGAARDDDEPPPPPRPMLDIGPLDPGTEDDVHVGDADWRLEATLSGPPIGPVDPAAGEVRGAFDFFQRGPRDWVVTWTSLEPAEEPIILAEDLEYAMVAVLTRETFWTDRLEAREMEDFPRSIRVVLMTRSGRTADWLLEPGVTYGSSR